MVKQGYKQTGIGVIPEDWNVRFLGDAFSKLEAGVSVNSDESITSEYYILKTSAVHGGVVNANDSKSVVKTDYPRLKCPLRAGSIIISRMNTPTLVGECGYVSVEKAGTFLPDRLWQIVNSKESEYSFVWLNYLLNTFAYRNAVRATATGTSNSMKNIAKERLLEIEIPNPPLPEQRAIAAALSDTDAYITTLEKLIAKKRAVQQGAMQELLTGKRRLPGLEGEWVEKELIEIADFYDNLRIPVTESKREVGTTPYYGANGIQGYIKGYTHDGEYVLIAEDGANDLNNYPVLYVNGKVWVNNHAHVIQGKVGKTKTKYLSYALKSVDFVQVLVGGTRAKLNGSAAKAIKVKIPNDIGEQTAIASILSDMDAEIYALTAKLNKAKHIKQGMMSELLTGKIRLIQEGTDRG